MKQSAIILSLLCIIALSGNAQPVYPKHKIRTGAERTDLYLRFLKGKTVAVFANQTSMVGGTHLVDTLVKKGVRIKCIFGPEHGFRGQADAGEKVGNETDPQTGIPIVSLYGKKTMPSPEDLSGVEVILFDIQDVGVRFYTYINSLQHLMESALTNDVPLIILDRPNPNGFYVDGPVLEDGFTSGIGLQHIPVVYGMTIGEYAKMLIGEKWLMPAANQKIDGPVCGPRSCPKKFQVMVVPLENYTHRSRYDLPVMPSPNLKTMQAVYLYPSVCFFEGTVLSEGRGTDMPFQIFGHPSLPNNLFAFTPKPNSGAKSGKCFFLECHGWKIDGSTNEILNLIDGKIRPGFLLDAYNLFPGKDSFFLKNNFIDKLAGSATLRRQVTEGFTEGQIRKSWQSGLEKFNATRKKYLLYE